MKLTEIFHVIAACVTPVYAFNFVAGIWCDRYSELVVNKPKK